MSEQIKTVVSGDGRYKIVATPAKDAQDPYKKWDIAVCHADGRLIAAATRNFHDLGPILFFQHGVRDYLLISEDYHGGYGCIDLNTGNKATHDPVDTAEHSQHWCWFSVVDYNQDTHMLRISGCYWAAPFNVVTWHVSDPMKPPYVLVCIEDDEGFVTDDASARAWLTTPTI